MTEVPQAKAGLRDRGVDLLERFGLLILALLILLVIPLSMETFRLGLVAKYLCFAFPAVGIVLFWGYGGILSLGQGAFFGMGSYMMAMFLKLESAANADSSSSTALAAFFGSAGLPDFMVWNSVDKLPWFWEPFHHVWITGLVEFISLSSRFLFRRSWRLSL
jgi:urea transport system permease protein